MTDIHVQWSTCRCSALIQHIILCGQKVATCLRPWQTCTKPVDGDSSTEDRPERIHKRGWQHQHGNKILLLGQWQFSSLAREFFNNYSHCENVFDTPAISTTILAVSHFPPHFFLHTMLLENSQKAAGQPTGEEKSYRLCSRGKQRDPVPWKVFSVANVPHTANIRYVPTVPWNKKKTLMLFSIVRS